MSRGKRGLILSLVVATTIFSTAVIANAASLNVNLDQCANGVPRQTVDCTWQNGDLNAQNSQWREGDGIPFRVVISGLTAGAHSIHINYDFIDNGKHAYDTLETYNATIVTPPIHDSLPTGVTFPSGSAISTAFPHDTTFDSGYNPETGLPRNLTTYGANSVTMGALTHSGDQGDLVVNFDNSTSGSDTIVMLWAGHLAIGTSGWGTGLGAASINGAPFHMRTQQLDGSGNKNQDRSIQPAAIILPPAITINKTADHTTVNAGEQIGYVVTLSNTGSGDATGVTLNDSLPGGSGINWSLAGAGTSIPSGVACAVTGTTPNQSLSCGTDPATTGTFTLAAGATITLHVTSPTTGGSCGTLHNTASFNSTNGGTGSVGPIDITINCPTLVLSKTADHATVNAGQSIGYVVTLHNSGAGDATGVTLSDPLPGGTGINWSLATSGTSIPSGIACAVHGTAPQTLSCGTDPATTGTFTLAAGATITLHVTSKTTAASCGTLHNTVSAHSDNDGSPTVGPINITINCPHITIAKTPDDGTATGGDTIAFTITVSNAGPGVAHDVVITDVLPSGGGLSWSIDAAGTTAANCSISSGTLTCKQGDLASGASVHVRVTSPTTAAECGSTIDNTGAVTLSNGDGGQDPGSITVSCPILSINIEKGGPDVTHVGDTVHYTLTVTNGTQEPLQNVVVTDTKCDSPPVLQSGDTNNDTILQPGEVWVYTCDHVVTSSDSDPLINVATVHATDKLGRPTEDQATHSVDILHPSISIVKTANPTSGAPGDTVTYTFVVKNTSTDTTLFNITVVDDKLGVINATPIASLAPGQSVTLTKTTTLPNAGGALTNVGTATGADVLGKKVSAHDNATVTVVLAVLVKTGTNSSGIGLVGFLFIAVGIAMATRKERGRVRPAFATSSSAAGRAVMLAANRRSWRMRRRRGPPTRARLRWRRSQGPPMRDGP